jgi:hypothetical protein
MYAWRMITAFTPAHPAGSARRATVAEWLAIPEDQRAELIHGTLVYDAFPGPKHGFTQGGVFAQLWPYNRHGGGGGSGGGGKPGGWWVSQEVDMWLGGIGCQPDVVGWSTRPTRRSRCSSAQTAAT